jgi:hypothetical protein
MAVARVVERLSGSLSYHLHCAPWGSSSGDCSATFAFVGIDGITACRVRARCNERLDDAQAEVAPFAAVPGGAGPRQRRGCLERSWELRQAGGEAEGVADGQQGPGAVPVGLGLR